MRMKVDFLERSDGVRLDRIQVGEPLIGRSANNEDMNSHSEKSGESCSPKNDWFFRSPIHRDAMMLRYLHQQSSVPATSITGVKSLLPRIDSSLHKLDDLRISLLQH